MCLRTATPREVREEVDDREKKGKKEGEIVEPM